MFLADRRLVVKPVISNCAHRWVKAEEGFKMMNLSITTSHVQTLSLVFLVWIFILDSSLGSGVQQTTCYYFTGTCSLLCESYTLQLRLKCGWSNVDALEFAKHWTHTHTHTWCHLSHGRCYSGSWPFAVDHCLWDVANTSAVTQNSFTLFNNTFLLQHSSYN